jgi:hypothetical protein
MPATLGNFLPEPETTGTEATGYAAHLVDEYFKPMALRVYGDAALPEAEHHAAGIARRIIKNKPTVVNAREIRRVWRIPGLATSAKINDALEVLLEADILRSAPSRLGETPGRNKSVAMSKWLQAARSARAPGSGLGPSYARANSAISANSSPERPIGTIGTNGTEGERLIRRANLAVVPDLSDPEDVRAWLDERAAMREDSGIVRTEADKAAFDELLWLWCAANPIDHTPGQCAACGNTLEPPAMSLPDGAQVCDKPDHGCLIAYGDGRRMEAVRAFGDTGVAPPTWWSL